MAKQERTYLPGFDSLRLLAALAVLFSHSYLISHGSEASEPLQQWLKGDKNIAGLYGVFTFFVISGYLLTSSLHRNPDLFRFCLNRALRLLPGFVCCTLFSALVVGPLCSSLSAAEYFSSPQLLRYLAESWSRIADASLPGVFNYAGPLSEVVNGSLWSLRAEILCYALLLGLWWALPSAGWMAVVFALAGAAALLHPAWLGWLPDNIGYPMPFFAAGVVIWWCTHHLGHSRVIAQLCGGGLLAGAVLGFPHQAFAVFGSYLVIAAGLRRTPLTAWIERHGDLSYGLFLFGWPIQQLIRQQLQVREPLLMVLLSTALTGLIAWGHHHAVERPAMQWRRPLLLLMQRLTSAEPRNPQTAAPAAPATRSPR